MPKPLFTKLVAVCAIGFFCLLLGAIYGIHTHDRIFLIMSLLIFLCSLVRFVILLQMIRTHAYRTLTGTCIKREVVLFGKTQKILFQGSDGQEYRFSLEKNIKLLQGHSYRLYFKLQEPQPERLLSSQNFLGYEEIQSTEPSIVR